MATATTFRAIDMIIENQDYYIDDEDNKQENKKSDKKQQEESKPKNSKPKKRVYTTDEKRAMEIAFIQLLARRDLLRQNLSKLDPGKKRDCKAIAVMNIELTMINQRIQDIEAVIGKRSEELDHGTKTGRAINKAKRGLRKIGNSIKRFVKRNRDIVEGVVTIAVPLLAAVVIKLVF